MFVERDHVGHPSFGATREQRLRHAPMRDLGWAELHQAFRRGFVTEAMYRAELMRRRTQTSTIETLVDIYGSR